MVSERAQVQLPNCNIIVFFSFKTEGMQNSDYSHCIHNWPVKVTPYSPLGQFNGVHWM